MPAKEQTWRDIGLLHRLFALSSVAMLLTTVWMLWADHARSWKNYQRDTIAIETRLTQWRENELADSTRQQEAILLAQLADAQAAAVDATLLEQFKAALANDAERLGSRASHGALDSAAQALSDAADALAQARENEAAATLDTLRTTAANRRTALLARLRDEVRTARFREDSLLRERKDTAALLDAARANEGIALRDGKPLEPAKQEVERLQHKLDEVTLDYQAAAAHRRRLHDLVLKITAEEDRLAKAVDQARTDLERLASARIERTSNYIDWWGSIPVPGKRTLELPILDAFNSPRKIENLWNDGLTIDFNFQRVRRFDRCTTCHQNIDKTLPGSAIDPQFAAAHTLVASLPTPAADELPTASEGQETVELSLPTLYGFDLGPISLEGKNEVTVVSVTTRSRAAGAFVSQQPLDPQRLDKDAIQQAVAEQRLGELLPDFSFDQGLQLGDVILRINDNVISDVAQARRLLIDSVAWGRPLTLVIRRGLPHPYSSHPRLDLFVGSLSPHPMATFGCTICHEGQGTATDFKWASHMPDSTKDRHDWTREYGWFDNHHWIYPMYPRRFAESGCLKCHHNVTELEPSERFPEPPAPKLVRGHELVSYYGCFGCHEVHGYDGPTRRIGPDVRLEPNYFAAALEIKADPRFAELDANIRDWIDQVAQHPDRDGVRRRLLQWLEEDIASPEPALSRRSHQMADLLRDIESPGSLRKTGPTLRHTTSKLDPAFLYDWIENPRHFRPSTRMPKFFGLWDHLAGEPAGLAQAEAYEPIEILGLVAYLDARSQPVALETPPAGISPSSDEEKIARGKQMFELRGCLACHNHADFPQAAAAREPGELVPGPDLTDLGSKFAADRNPRGRAWLYSWIKEPTKYNPRTIMPDLFLDPIVHGDGAVTDPADDIVAYLMSSRSTDWQPPAADVFTLDEAKQRALRELSLEFLTKAFFTSAAQRYYEQGIPEEMRAELKGAELELIVAEGAALTDQQRLVYVGSKVIAKYGCYGCHDIPGFEDAKPIGAVLSDWGRKEPAKLAFEHINEYLGLHGHAGPGAKLPDGGGHGHGGNGHGGNGAHAAAAGHGGAGGHPALDPRAVSPAGAEDERTRGPRDPFFDHAIAAGHREGFIWQKLYEPRSYDYFKTENKEYNDRLRMPQFPFGAEQREAIITFVLGLVADPPESKFIYQGDVRSQALHAGRRVLEKYNCGGCHLLDVEKWSVAFPPGTFSAQAATPTYPFVNHHFTPEQLAASGERSADRSGLIHATIEGVPTIGDADGRPTVYDDELFPLEPGEAYDPTKLVFAFELWRPAALDGHGFQAGGLPLEIDARMIRGQQAARGGYLSRLLVSRVTEIEQAANPNAKGSEAWAWLPPPLIGQGWKTQPDWLYRFLLDPQPIRPAVFLRMPRFNLSNDEATALVNYFGAVENVHSPYEFDRRATRSHLAAAEALYRQRLEEAGIEPAEGASARFDAAMKIVTNKNYCITCHLVNDFVPAGSDRAKAPNLATIYQRLRPEFTRNWIANPKRILPYTAMPVNIPFDPDSPTLGGVSQDLFHGTSIEQLDALVDLLMNFDRFTETRSAVTPLVEANNPPEAAEPEPAEAPAAADAAAEVNPSEEAAPAAP